ncbi:hypothetical protein BJX99DRAFT_213426 [Aspergillus californicus]
MAAAIEYGYLGDWYARGLNETSYSEVLYPFGQLKKGVEIKIPKGGLTIIQGWSKPSYPLHRALVELHSCQYTDVSCRATILPGETVRGLPFSPVLLVVDGGVSGTCARGWSRLAFCTAH